MPRFHLHLWEDGQLLPDEDGVFAPNLSTVTRLARLSLAELLCEDLRTKDYLLNRCVVVTQEDGTTVAELSTQEVVKPLQRCKRELERTG